MIDLRKIKTIYFVGIKGVGMSALAVLAKEMGKKVLGSDTEEEFPTDNLLKKNKIPIMKGFSSENLSLLKNNNSLVITTGAHKGLNNPECLEAILRKIPVITHGKALGFFMKGKRGISVAGSHGKTTTTALISHILIKAGLDPCFTVGAGKVNSLGTSGHFGKGDYFIAEADEYAADPENDLTPRFLYQNPEIEVFTNIDYDHPDFFSSLLDVKKVFLKFTKKLSCKGLLIAGADDKNLRSILSQINAKVLTYGFSSQTDFQITNASLEQEKNSFRAKFKGIDLGKFVLKIPGKHNILNAVAASLCSNHIGISWDKIKKALKSYTGTSRRFEFKNKKNNISFYDDYAHHPKEIKETLKAAKKWFGFNKRLIVVFQPHTYSRTKALKKEFTKSFKFADLVFISDIYTSAREKKDKTISSKILTQETLKYQKKAIYSGSIVKSAEKLKKYIKKNDIIFTMGAGDIYKLHKYFI